MIFCLCKPLLLSEATFLTCMQILMYLSGFGSVRARDTRLIDLLALTANMVDCSTNLNGIYC